MKTSTTLIVMAFLFSISERCVGAQGTGTTAGLTLTEASGARSTALGEAFTASNDDITGLSYNPASIQSLSSAQASFLYRTGMADDSYGQFMLGSPFKSGAVGLSIGYFNGGKIDLFDGIATRNVTVQRDVAVGLGFSHSLGNVDIGVTGKYLSSQLIEEKTATAFAADAGVQLPLNARLRFGASILNLGTKLKYKEKGDKLPTSLRSGISLSFSPSPSAAHLLIDGLYDINNSKLSPAIGVEKPFGPVFARAGYNGSNDLHHFSLGLGIVISRLSFDYSFGFVNDLDSVHMVSLSTNLGSLPVRSQK